MKTRREFLRRASGYLISLGFLCSPLLMVIRTVFAKVRRVVLPRGTKMESLINQNPAELDPTNLEITPVQDFGTMGLDNHKVDLDTWRLEVNGHVSKSLRLSYGEITALPSIEKAVLIICPGFFATESYFKMNDFIAHLLTILSYIDLSHFKTII